MRDGCWPGSSSQARSTRPTSTAVAASSGSRRSRPASRSASATLTAGRGLCRCCRASSASDIAVERSRTTSPAALGRMVPGRGAHYRGRPVLLETISRPEDVRRLSYPELQHPGRRDPPVHRRRRHPHRRAPRLQPRRRRAHPRGPPGVRLPHGHRPVGHRPPGLRPQDRHRPARRLRRPPPGRRPLGLPEPGRSPSTTGSRTATPRRSSATPTASPPRTRWAPCRRRPGVPPEDLADRRIVAVIGDGSMTGGMAFEGLNNLGHSGRKAIIILNDNGRSYAPTVSKLTESVARLRVNPNYRRQRARLEQLIDRMPMSDQLHKGLEATTAALREYFEPRAFFEDLGVRYTGPFDGHDIAGLERALRNAAERGGTDRRPRPHAEGPWLRAGRERPRQAAARHGPVRGEAGQLHRRLHRGDLQGRRGPSRPRRHHRGDARLHRPARLRRAVPGPADRRRHRRAARRHRRRRHGDGRAPARRRRLLDVPHPGHRPGDLRRRACTASRSCSPSTAPASPATTAPRTTACSTWCCSPRCRA